jgi:hypothetical protein
MEVDINNLPRIELSSLLNGYENVEKWRGVKLIK